jgi:CTP-dependent riboflavin kinase
MAKDDIEKSVLISKIAGYVAQGTDKKDIVRELGITQQRLVYLMRLPECVEKINKLLDEATLGAVKEAKKQFANLLPKAIRAIERKLEDDADLKAAEIVLKGLGALKEDEAPQQATAIQVVLPSGETRDVIEVNDETTS